MTTESLTGYERRLCYWTPEEWKGPLSEVIDTAAAVTLGVRDELKIEPTAELIAALTRLVLERHDWAAMKGPRSG